MNKDKLPFTNKVIEEAINIARETPFYIYDKNAIIENIKNFQKAFSWVDNFKEYYAVKACPNPYILEILKENGAGADCSSLWELILAEKVGIIGEDIMFTSNDTPIEDYKKAKELGAIINFDDISHIPFFIENIWPIGELACCRYNPWNDKKWNSIIWNPTEAKYWMTKGQIKQAYKILKENWVKRFWLHTMVASNELDEMYFVETAKILFELVLEIEKEIGIQIEFVNLWWGIWIPYKPGDKPVDYFLISQEIKKLYDKLFSYRKKPLNIVVEMWRMITWPYAYLVTKVQHIKDTYKKYIWTDASMADLMRPGMYWAYHHITVLWKENEKEKEVVDVTGSLCENNDKFAIDRKLPKIGVWDLLVIHDVWAHGHAMWFNYNAKLRPAELLWDSKTWKIELIRRAETLKDYFTTLNFPGSKWDLI